MASATVAELYTSAGEIDLRLFPEKAPNHVNNFRALAENGFYNGTKFHRVIPGFMIQGGDPNTISGDPSTWGTGGSGQTIAAEFNDVHHGRGIVSMARAVDPNSASSQFFICVADAGFLDGQYTVFGEVIRGMDVVDEIASGQRGQNDRPFYPTTINRIVLRNDDAVERTDADAAQTRTQSFSVPGVDRGAGDAHSESARAAHHPSTVGANGQANTEPPASTESPSTQALSADQKTDVPSTVTEAAPASSLPKPRYLLPPKKWRPPGGR